MKTTTVSLVEDDGPNRQLLIEMINRGPGLRCTSSYPDGRHALVSLPKEQPDVVLMDINLPDISGIECVRRLKPLLPNTQFLMLTVYADTEHIFSALSAGATGYLLKITRETELREAIEQIQQGGSPMTGAIARKVVQSFKTTASQRATLETLSAREQGVLDLLAQGFLYKEIADSLGIGVPTVCTYIRRIYEKLHVQSRGQAVAKYLSQRE